MKNLVLILASLFFVSSTVMANQADSNKKGVHHSEVKAHHEMKKDKKAKRAAKVKPLTPAQQKEMQMLRDQQTPPNTAPEPSEETIAPK